MKKTLSALTVAAFLGGAVFVSIDTADAWRGGPGYYAGYGPYGGSYRGGPYGGRPYYGGGYRGGPYRGGPYGGGPYGGGPYGGGPYGGGYAPVSPLMAPNAGADLAPAAPEPPAPPAPEVSAPVPAQ